MARFLLYLVAAALIGVCAAVHEDCEVPPVAKFASIHIEDEEDTIRAIYTCQTGYELQGPTELICDLDTDEWNADPPKCIKPTSSNEVHEQEPEAPKTKEQQQKPNIPEDRMVSAALASTLDMSCVQAKVKAPEIRYGVVQKYDRRRKGDKVFLVALYACNDNFEFEDTETNTLYCSERKWVGDLPICVSLGEYGEEEEEEYEEYETTDDEDEEDVRQGGDEEEVDRQANPVAPPQPLPPVQSQPQPQPQTPAEDFEELSNEIDPVETERRHDNSEETNQVEHTETEKAPTSTTDSHEVVESTQDPYTPRVIDANCGDDNGGCDQMCQRVMFPGENQPRIQCSCSSGFSLDPYDYSTCHDINECELSNGGCEQVCQNLPGSFKCSCESGLQINTLTGNTCIDIDECLLRNGHGPCQDTCHNLWSSYRCTCDTLPGTQLSPDNHTCVDAGECSHNNGGCSHTCLSSLGRIFCLCPPGYRMTVDDKTCEDINECELPEITEECPTGCENTHGSYRCITPLNNREDAAPAEEHTEEPKINTPPAATECSAGFKAHSGQCVDVDECAEGTSGCEICLNTEGSYECTCPPGYDLGHDERTCVDIDECAIVTDDDENEASYRVCSHGCQNTVGSFHCTCPPLFHLTYDRRTCAADTCADLENSSLNKTRCSYECVDLPGGSYECRCPKGYGLADAYTCVELEDVCQSHNGDELCAPGSCRADDTETSFTCVCPAGYRTENQRCVDVDECAEDAALCSHRCVNTEGAYRCECVEGFVLSAGSQHLCEDVNECVVDEGVCGILQCVNLAGSFNCLCTDGSEPNGEGICRSMISDPCSSSRCSHECIPNGDSFRCVCPGAMILDESQLNCLEPDVCAVNKNGCDHICNSEYNGACSCHSGFTLDVNGKSCLDIDECQVNNGGCHQFCTNIAGSYACACDIGFELAEDKKTCLDIDECSRGQHDCSHECVNFEGGYKCTCPLGYFLGETSTVCIDVDECSGADHGCSHDCYNTKGSYLCACPDGFKLSPDEKTCISSLCLEDNGGCSHMCDPGQGCSCPAGMTLGSDGKTCEDFNECLANNGGCAFKCVNLAGSYECVCPDGSKPANPGDACPITCPAGFTFARDDPNKCEDIDECSLPGVCQYQCRNTNGSYECLCPKGYRLEDGHECADIDECAENNGGCVGGDCFNHNGGYECRCAVGQRLAADRKTCEIVQELRDQCQPLEAPANGAIHCTKFRHKKKRFYNTRCKVWCNQGFQLEGPSHRHCNSSGQWDHHENQCLPATCPRLASPQNGIISPVSCTFGKINVGEHCRLKCNVGHVPAGKSVAVCTSQMQWSYNDTFDCVPMQTETRRLGTSNGFTPFQLPATPTLTLPSIPSTFGGRPLPDFGYRPTTYAGGVGIHRPYIKCPRNTTVFLGTGERTAHIILQKPITNLDYRYIESSPAWTKNLQAHLGAGTYAVVFRGHDPLTGRKARCKTVINVKHAEGPTVEYCTPSFDVILGEHQDYRSVVWEEPRFNSKFGALKKVFKSRLPGELFGLGVHSVYYEATNDDGITAKCEFKIHVKSHLSSSESSLVSNNLDANAAGASVPNYHTGLRPGGSMFTSPVLTSPVSHPAMISAPLLAGHESFIICPGRDPVKVTRAQSVDLPPNCILKNVRINPFRQFMSQRVMPRLWSSYGRF